MDNVNKSFFMENLKLAFALFGFVLTLVIIQLLINFFTDYDIIYYMVWPFWPFCGFVIYRFLKEQKLKPDSGSNPNISIKKMVIYCGIGFILILFRAFTCPFSFFEQVSFVLWLLYPLFFPSLFITWRTPLLKNHRMIISIYCFLILIVFCFNSLTSGLFDFLYRDKNYYVKVSQACNKLLSTSSAQFEQHNWEMEGFPHSGDWRIKGDDNLIPPFLKKLNATMFVIPILKTRDESMPKSIDIMIGVSRMGFRIGWESKDNKVWSLVVGGEGVEKVIYSTGNRSGVSH